MYQGEQKTGRKKAEERREPYTSVIDYIRTKFRFAPLLQYEAFEANGVMFTSQRSDVQDLTDIDFRLVQCFLTGGTRTPWGYEEPKRWVRSTKIFRDTRPGNLNQIFLNIHRYSL